MSQAVRDITTNLGDVHGGGKIGDLVQGAKKLYEKVDPFVHIGNAARKVKGLWDRATDDK